MREVAFTLFAFLSILHFSLCQGEEVIQTSINGCSLKHPEYSKGLKGTIYEIDGEKITSLFNPAFYQGGFSTELLHDTFFSTGNAHFSPSDSHSSAYIIEETGYFKGMFYCSIFLSTLSLQLTNTLFTLHS